MSPRFSRRLFVTLAAGGLLTRGRSLAATGEVLLGGSLPLTGPMQSLGEEVAEAFDSQTFGTSLRIDWLNDGGDHERATSNYEQLLGRGCTAFVGVLGLDRLGAARYAARNSETPMMVLGCQGVRSGPTLRNDWLPPELEANVLLGALASTGRRRLAVIYELTGGGRSLVSAVSRQASETGVQIVAEIGTRDNGLLELETRDVFSYVQAEGANAVLLAVQGEGPARFATLSRDFGFLAPLLLASNCDEEPLSRSLLGTENAHRRSAVLLVRSQPALASGSASALLADYLRFAALRQTAPSELGLEAWVQARALASSIREAPVAGDGEARSVDSGRRGWMRQALSTSPRPRLYAAGLDSWREVDAAESVLAGSEDV